MVMQPGGGQPGPGVGPTGTSSGRFVVVLRFPSGESIQVLVTAPTRQAAEMAAIRNFGTRDGQPVPGVSSSAVDAAQFPPDYLKQIQQQIDVTGGAGGQIDAPVPNIPPKGPSQGGTLPVIGPKPLNTTGAPYLGEETEFGRSGSFQRALSRTGRNLPGAFGQYEQQQFDPYQRAYNARVALGQYPAEQAIGGETGPAGGGFGQFVQNTPNAFRSALDSLRQIRGLARPVQEQNAPSQMYFAPEQEDLGELRGLFDAALQGRVGGAAAQFLRRFIPQVNQQYAAGNNQDYLATLQQRLGLGNALF